MTYYWPKVLEFEPSYPSSVAYFPEAVKCPECSYETDFRTAFHYHRESHIRRKVPVSRFPAWRSPSEIYPSVDDDEHRAIAISSILDNNGTADNGATDNGITDNGITDNEVVDNDITDNDFTDNDIADNDTADNDVTDDNNNRYESTRKSAPRKLGKSSGKFIKSKRSIAKFIKSKRSIAKFIKSKRFIGKFIKSKRSIGKFIKSKRSIGKFKTDRKYETVRLLMRLKLRCKIYLDD